MDLQDVVVWRVMSVRPTDRKPHWRRFTWHHIHGPALYLLGRDANDLLGFPLTILESKCPLNCTKCQGHRFLKMPNFNPGKQQVRLK